MKLVLRLACISYTGSYSRRSAGRSSFVIENLAEYDVPYPVVFDVEMITGQDGRANNLTMQERTDITIAFCEAVKASRIYADDLWQCQVLYQDAGYDEAGAV